MAGVRRCSVAERVRCGLDMSININKDRGTWRDVNDGERGGNSERRTLIQRVITPALVLMLAMSIQRVASGEWRAIGGDEVGGEFFESTP